MPTNNKNDNDTSKVKRTSYNPLPKKEQDKSSQGAERIFIPSETDGRRILPSDIISSKEAEKIADEFWKRNR